MEKGRGDFDDLALSSGVILTTFGNPLVHAHPIGYPWAKAWDTAETFVKSRKKKRPYLKSHVHELQGLPPAAHGRGGVYVRVRSRQACHDGQQACLQAHPSAVENSKIFRRPGHRAPAELRSFPDPGVFQHLVRRGPQVRVHFEQLFDETLAQQRGKWDPPIVVGFGVRLQGAMYGERGGERGKHLLKEKTKQNKQKASVFCFVSLYFNTET